MMSTWDAVWVRARTGKHTVIVGPGVVLSVPSDLIVVQVSCQTSWTVGGPLDEALRRVMQLVGDEMLEAAQAAMQPQPGLRSWLLDAEPGRPRLSVFVEACNQLAAASDNRAVLCFEAVEAADTSTVATLGQILQRPGWLRLGLVADTVAPCIHQNEPVVVLQRFDVPHFVPGFQAICEPMLENQRRSYSFHLVMDSDSLIIGVWHTRYFLP